MFDEERDGHAKADGDDGTADDDSDTVTTQSPTMTKIRLNPSLTTWPAPTPAPVRIGQYVQYEIELELPIGEVRNLVVTDTFAPGLIFIDEDDQVEAYYYEAVNESGDSLTITPDPSPR